MLYVPFAIVAAICFLLSFVKVGLSASFQGETFKIAFRFGFLRMTFFPPGKTVRKEKKRRKPTRKAAERPDFLSGIDWNKAIFGGISEVRNILSFAKRRLKIDVLFLSVTVGAPEPSAVALRCGQLNLLAGILLPILANNFNMRSSEIQIEPDFQQTRILARGELSCSITLRDGVLLSAYAAFRLWQLWKRVRKKAGGPRSKKFCAAASCARDCPM